MTEVNENLIKNLDQRLDKIEKKIDSISNIYRSSFSRVMNIENRVIKANDIKYLAKQLSGIYNDWLLQNQAESKSLDIHNGKLYPNLKLDIFTRDNCSFSYDSFKEFDNEKIVDHKVITKIVFKLKSNSSNVSIWLTDSRYGSNQNIVEVEGNDSNWVNATFQNLLDIVNSWEKQDSKIKKYRGYLSFGTAAILAWSIYIIISWRFGSDGAILGAIISFLIAIIGLDNFSENLWPSIEFVPELEHERVLAKKRQRLNWLFSVVIIPLIMAVILTFMKSD